MERLTGWDGDRAYVCNLPIFEMPVYAHDLIRSAVERLAAYEDTGLEPQTLQEILDSVSEWYDAHKEGRRGVSHDKVLHERR